MIVDPRQRLWLTVTLAAALSAAVLDAALARAPWPALAAGSRLRVAYGLAGAMLVAFAGLYGVIRRLPRFRFRMAVWLRAHLWLGVLGVMMLVIHGGYRTGGGVTAALWFSLALLCLTGGYGSYLQKTLPPAIAARLPSEIPDDVLRPRPARRRARPGVWGGRIPDACDWLAAQAGACLEDNRRPESPGERFRPAVEAVYREQIRPFLGSSRMPASRLRDADTAADVFRKLELLSETPADRDLVRRLAGFCATRRHYGELERLHDRLHAWRPWHAVLTLVTLALAAAHVREVAPRLRSILIPADAPVAPIAGSPLAGGPR